MKRTLWVLGFGGFLAVIAAGCNQTQPPPQKLDPSQIKVEKMPSPPPVQKK